jgi:hypothetical protein
MGRGVTVSLIVLSVCICACNTTGKSLWSPEPADPYTIIGQPDSTSRYCGVDSCECNRIKRD